MQDEGGHDDRKTVDGCDHDFAIVACSDIARATPPVDKQPVQVATFDDLEPTERFFRKGIDVNARDGLFGDTMLTQAASRNLLEVARLPLHCGIDVNAANGKCRTAMDIAKEENHKEIEPLIAAR